jgi:hypothetical protein
MGTLHRNEWEAAGNTQLYLQRGAVEVPGFKREINARYGQLIGRPVVEDAAGEEFFVQTVYGADEAVIDLTDKPEVMAAAAPGSAE